MNYSYSGCILKLGGKRIRFFSPIKEVLEADGVLLILLKRIGVKLDYRESMNRNIYAYDSIGQKLWEIQESPSGGSKDKPYTAVYLEAGKVVAYNGLGFEYKLNLIDGSVEPLGGRPW